MASDATHITDPVLPVQGPEITSDASMRSRLGANPMPQARSGGGEGLGAPCARSLTEEAHVRNLKNNCSRAFRFGFSAREGLRFEDDPWFASVVEKLRDRPCQDNSLLEIMGTPTFNMQKARPLHLAVLMGNREMVRKILETRLAPPNEVDIDSVVVLERTRYSALDLAIVCGDNEMVDALLERKAKVNTPRAAGSLQLAVLHAHAGEIANTSKIIQSLLRTGIDINDKDPVGYSAFYVAVAQRKTDVVKELLKWKDQIQLNERCGGGPPPIQIAHEEGFTDIESLLMQCEDVQRYIESAYRDRQAYVDAANAILVGAALIASITFASWLQPPLSYTASYQGSSLEYADVEHNSALGSFWVFNTLSFYFAIGTVVFGAHSVLPRSELFITKTVKKLSQKLLLTSILLAFSVIFVIVAFGIAGFIVLIPVLRYRWYMIAPTILGGIVCVGSIVYLFKSLWENRPWNIRNRQRNRTESNFVGIVYHQYREEKKRSRFIEYSSDSSDSS